MSVKIRIRTPEDYPAMVKVYNSAYPPDTAQTSVEDLRHMDTSFGEKFHPRRAVLLDEGRIVGVSRSAISPMMYHPQKFVITIAVHPDSQRRGYGTMLYEEQLSAIAQYDPILVRSFCCEDSANSVGFLVHHDFREEDRAWESNLDISAFDFTFYKGIVERVIDSGIRFVPLSELPKEGDWEQRLYDLIIHVQTDMPSPEPFTPYSFEEWKTFEFSRPNRKPDSFVIALDGERMVGVSILMHEPSDSTQLNTDDTGVIREYRRRGIALALKLHGIARSREQGYTKIRTMNESTNRPMLNINERLGFVKRPAWIGYVCNFK